MTADLQPYALLPEGKLDINYYVIKDGKTTDVLTGKTEAMRDTRVHFTVAIPGGPTKRYRIESWVDDDRLALWHESGQGSSESVGPQGEAGVTVDQLLVYAQKHARHPEDPRGPRAMVKGDLKVHMAFAWAMNGTQCGQSIDGMRRVLWSSVPSDRVCGRCQY